MAMALLPVVTECRISLAGLTKCALLTIIANQEGLYQRARAGKIPAFTGISSPYEEPDRPELVVETGACTVDEGVAKILSLLEARGVIP